MKRFFSQCFATFSSLFFIGFSNTASAECCKQHDSVIESSNEKCYLIPGSLLMDENKLYVKFNETLFPVSNVSVDGQGVYVLANDLVDSKKVANCPVGHPNPPWLLVCMVCGRPLY